MSEEEYLDFIRTLYHDLLEPNFTSVLSRSRRHHFFEFDEQLWEIDRLVQTMQTLRFIDRTFSQSENLGQYLRPALFARVRDTSRSGLSWTSRLLDDSGVIDGIQENFDEIVEGMRIEHFPEADTDILARSGSSGPRTELNGIIYKIKARRSRLTADARQTPFRRQISQASERIASGLESAAADEPEEDQGESQQQQRPVTRRLFKGLSGVVQGSLLTLVNVAIASSMWSIPVTEDTKAVGSVMSITTGIGCILNGIGEFRGE